MLKLMWQDYVLSIGLIVFGLALIPTIRGNTKPPLSTSVPTALVQYVFVITFASLNLWFSTLGSLVIGTLWTVLAVQAYQKTKGHK